MHSNGSNSCNLFDEKGIPTTLFLSQVLRAFADKKSIIKERKLKTKADVGREIEDNQLETGTLNHTAHMGIKLAKKQSKSKQQDP